jgi:phage host-nuclease inhibitor protein Gam
MEQEEKISPQELAEVNGAIATITPIEAEIARLSIQKLTLQGEIDAQYEKWRAMSNHIESLKKRLADKYGDANIDVRTGEIKRSK